MAQKNEVYRIPMFVDSIFYNYSIAVCTGAIPYSKKKWWDVAERLVLLCRLQAGWVLFLYGVRHFPQLHRGWTHRREVCQLRQSTWTVPHIWPGSNQFNSVQLGSTMEFRRSSPISIDLYMWFLPTLAPKQIPLDPTPSQQWVSTVAKWPSSTSIWLWEQRKIHKLIKLISLI
jgi:hypothetical protein